MRNLAPEITRQRLLVEGRCSIVVDRAAAESYLLGVAAHLGLRGYGEPMVHAPEGLGKEENEGFDAFLPLIDSGISLYVWTSAKFFAVVLFTCKEFDVQAALEYTQDYFDASELEHRSF